MTTSQPVVIITGAGTGLGKELTLQLANEGARLAVCGRRQSKIEELKDSLSDYRDQVVTLSLDVSHEMGAKQLVQTAVDTFGRVDVLINCAAVFINHSIVETSLSAWEYHFQNSLTNAFLVSKECLPIFRRQGRGQIVNFTSSLARTGASGYGAYSATKAALEAFTYTLNEEERKYGIRAHVVNPGVMKTAMHARGCNPRDVAAKLSKFIRENQDVDAQAVYLEAL
ncbi:SDR family NAD(P)-dependent oxidoreductase [Ammoniphilus oxalaticus]|uniref:SDR family NAD(P)-dependent oxidoreductase n=1 Tax=Ammoniphilus oxalaticus TaxID=66863 RepID=UPI000E7676F3|nr:SDR family oxidoreductase [Ammoniphilus oxalaticus]